MKLRSTFATLLCAAASWGQPALRVVNPAGNAASYATGIAQGSIFVVIGTDLGGPDLVQNAALPVGTALGNASIRLAPVSGGATVDAYMIYTTQNQLAGLLPSTAAAGDYDLTVTYNGQTSGAARVTVVAAAFGIVSVDSSGTGQAQAQEYRSATAADLNRPASGVLGSFTLAPARPGQVMVLWGTGLGADAQSDPAGGTSGDKTASANVRVIVGSREIVPAYAGRSSGLPGTDQINFTLPSDVDLGCFVNVAVRVGTVMSNMVTIATAANNATACTHPLLTEDQLRGVSQGGTLTLGSLGLSKQTIMIAAPGLALDTSSENVTGGFARYDIGNLAGFGGDRGAGTVGQCTVFQSDPAAASSLRSNLLNAGEQLTLNGPNANNTAIPRGPGNTYSTFLVTPGPPGGGAKPPAVIAAGTYTVTGTGGADIGAFSARLNMPPPLDWSNQAAIAEIVRSAGVTPAWTGAANTLAVITGSSDAPGGGAVAFTCLADGNAGSFTVPASILSQLPAAAGNFGIRMTAGPGQGGAFTAPLSAGGSIDNGVFTGTVGFQKSVTYK